jgi:hypothetical protein
MARRSGFIFNYIAGSRPLPSIYLIFGTHCVPGDIEELDIGEDESTHLGYLVGLRLR